MSTKKAANSSKEILEKLGKSLPLSINFTEKENRERFEYPQNKYVYKKPTSASLKPYDDDSWFHDEQVDDVLTDESKRITKIFEKLLNVEYPPQRSPKWFEMRESSITASDSGCVLGDNSHEPPYKIYVKKLQKPPFEANLMCYHGTKLEEIATMVYEYRLNVKMEEFGLVKHPKYNFLAASPDGIIGTTKLDGKHKTRYVGRMLEIKCPAMRKIMDDKPFHNIQYYWDQVQLQLECCDLEECDFWQNTIKEYTDRQEYIDDTDDYEPFRSKKTGMEKGCLIQFLPRSKMVDALEKYDDIICQYSKHLYPPKIDMSPFEYDIWISKVLSDPTQALIDSKMKNHIKINEIIKREIGKNNNNDFLEANKNELQNLIDEAIKNNNWRLKTIKSQSFLEKEKEKIAIQVKEKMIDSYLNNYTKKLMFPDKCNDFILFLIRNNIPEEFHSILDDPNLISKIVNINDNVDFFKIIDGNIELNFIKKMCELLADMDFAKNYIFDKIYYWRFEKTLCTTVKRDREWFAKVLPIFEKTWKNIEFLRANPDAAKIVFEYIESLPSVDENYGHPLKDNDTVMTFIDFICNKPTKKTELKKYNDKIAEMLKK